jgi:hypothetical protein
MVREQVAAHSTPGARQIPGNVGATWLMRAEADIDHGNYGSATPVFTSGSAQVASRNKTTNAIAPHEPNATPVSTTVFNMSDRLIKNDDYFLATRTQDGTLIVVDVYARPGSGMIAKVNTGGITARSGTTAGSGSVTAHKLVGTTITSTTETMTVYNLSDAAIAADRWVQCKREWYTGHWFVDFEDC